MNDNGNPSAKFKEGENIQFYLSLKNISKEEIIIKGNFITEDFFMVYKGVEKVGKPWTGIYCEFRNDPQLFEIQPNESVSFCLPWQYSPEELQIFYPFCGIGVEKEALKTGEYSCKFPINLNYTKNGKEKKISNLFFIINFKVE